jgi:hypothetical protein
LKSGSSGELVQRNLLSTEISVITIVVHEIETVGPGGCGQITERVAFP